MITYATFLAAIQHASSLRLRREQEQRAAAANKQGLVAAQEAEWQAELQRRTEAALDADGSRAAARAAREEQLEQERLDLLTAQLVRRIR